MQRNNKCHHLPIYEVSIERTQQPTALCARCWLSSLCSIVDLKVSLNPFLRLLESSTSWTTTAGYKHLTLGWGFHQTSSDRQILSVTPVETESAHNIIFKDGSCAVGLYWWRTQLQAASPKFIDSSRSSKLERLADCNYCCQLLHAAIPTYIVHGKINAFKSATYTTQQRLMGHHDHRSATTD